MRNRGRSWGVVALVGILLLSGCASFDETPPGQFRANPPLGAGPEPTPVVPSPAPPPGPSVGGSAPPGPAPTARAGPCVDPDPAVVATCLGATGGIAVSADGTSALVAERGTGRLLRVAPGSSPVLVDTVPVDGSGDGGLLDVVASPTYDEDQLLYLYLSTPTDNRVVRIAVGDSPKPILTGIPHGPTGNSGGIAFDATGDLLVLTGSAGDPTAAANPASLAGKLLRITAQGTPAGAVPGSPVLAADLGAGGGVCTDAKTHTSWVTDRTAAGDRLRAVTGTGLSRTVWAWPDAPGVAGCAALGGRVAVALTSGQSLFVLTTSPELAVLAKPEVLAARKYGRLSGADVDRNGLVWVGTVNKDGGTPTATDDRVVRIQPSSGRGGNAPV
ncbi:MAG: PQQ-dependent sugar dehydrogenase [Mycobacteriaceae bacterium]